MAPKDYDKYSDRSKRRDRSRSRSRSRSNSRNKNLSSSFRDKREKKTTKWSDAPPESSSKFSDAPVGFEKETNNISADLNNLNNLQSKKNTNNVSKSSSNFQTKSKVNPLSFLEDNTKIKKKIFIPKSSEINYVGLLIGPKGTYQKGLEQKSGCKILIRGKGTQKEGNPPQPDDNEEKHVLIVGDTDEKVSKAQFLIEKVLFADEKTRTKIKEEQIKASQEIRSELLMQGTDTIPQIEEFMLTPYGPPDKNARIVPVPNDCVGLIIGKNGETIRRLNRESGCKVQIAIKPIPNTEVRNVFIEGPPEKYEVAKKLIEEIISEQISLKEKNPFFHLAMNNHLNPPIMPAINPNVTNAQNQPETAMGQINPFAGPHTPLRIPNKMVGLIIGRNGETVKTIHEKTGCYIFIPKESRPGEDFRELQLSGPPGSVELCKREIISMIHLALYGRLPYMNSLFYPFLDPITGLPIIDPNTLSQLDPNTKISENQKEFSDTNTQSKENYNYTNSASYYENEEADKAKKGYDLNDYDNPMNYDLYFQSLYQMYPHMNDYVNKNSSATPFIICNYGLGEQDNKGTYDPNYIVSMYNQMVDDNLQNAGDNQDINDIDNQQHSNS